MTTKLPLLATVLLVSLCGCHHAPQTAAELMQRLPRRFTGQVHLQGESNSQSVRVETRELGVRDKNTLEFSGLNLVLLGASGGIQSEHPVACRGSISAPGLAIQLEDLGRGEDMVKPGTFTGRLSEDLQTVEASWTTGFGGKGSLKLSANP